MLLRLFKLYVSYGLFGIIQLVLPLFTFSKIVIKKEFLKTVIYYVWNILYCKMWVLKCVWIISLKASIFIERKSILCSSVWCSCCCCCCCCCCFSGWGITPFQAIIAGKATALTKAEVQILKTKGSTQKSGLNSEWIVLILIVVNFLLSKATTFVNGPEHDIWYAYIKVEIQQV